jgi:hypothetical protein
MLEKLLARLKLKMDFGEGCCATGITWGLLTVTKLREQKLKKLPALKDISRENLGKNRGRNLFQSVIIDQASLTAKMNGGMKRSERGLVT